jgi:ABC-type Fe3+-hydroxamate transport system substrate-binding protein
MVESTDQMGNMIMLLEYPKSIISLVPSLTELLFDLGLDSEISGVTRYCILPKDKVAYRTKIGGTKKFDFDVIDRLKPDLIIGNKEENYPKGILKLHEKYPVWMSDISNVEDALQMIESVGELVNRSAEARHLINEIKSGLYNMEYYPPLKAAYLIWKNPYMTVGGDTFINDMLKRCGFVNIFESERSYPRITSDKLGEAEVILLSSEPYSFSSEDIEDLKNQYPDRDVRIVDGCIFSWYGSHLRYAAAYFKKLRDSLAKKNV